MSNPFHKICTLRTYIFVFLPICLKSLLLSGQPKTTNSESLNIGSISPKLAVQDWYYGAPITNIEKGRFYVVEFWSTWCSPCLKSFLPFNRIARKFKTKATFLSVNVLEKKNYPKERAKQIIDSLNRTMKLDFSVGFEEEKKISEGWFGKIWDASVPLVVLIDSTQQISWIGDIENLKEHLTKVLNGEWDKEVAAKKRIEQQSIIKQDYETRDAVMPFFRNGYASDYFGNPDSVLSILEELERINPSAANGSNFVYHKFVALIKNDLILAEKYAENVLKINDDYYVDRYTSIINGLKYITRHQDVSPQLYSIGAKLLYEHGGSISKNLLIACNWFWLAGNKTESVKCLRKAKKVVKKAKNNGFGSFF